MSPLRRISYALVVSICLHFLFLVVMCGRWGSLSGPFKVPGILLVELIRLGSRGAEARVAPKITPFQEQFPQHDHNPEAKTPPALNRERSPGHESVPAKKKTSAREQSSIRAREIDPDEPEGAESSLPTVNVMEEGGNVNEIRMERPHSSTGQESHPPRCASCPQPPYPPLALERGLEGEVGLSVQVLTDGCVGDIFVETSSGYPLLDEAALKCVKGWIFHPARENGSPTSFIKRVKIRFRLGTP